MNKRVGIQSALILTPPFVAAIKELTNIGLAGACQDTSSSGDVPRPGNLFLQME